MLFLALIASVSAEDLDFTEYDSQAAQICGELKNDHGLSEVVYVQAIIVDYLLQNVELVIAGLKSVDAQLQIGEQIVPDFPVTESSYLRQLNYWEIVRLSQESKRLMDEAKVLYSRVLELSERRRNSRRFKKSEVQAECLDGYGHVKLILGRNYNVLTEPMQAWNLALERFHNALMQRKQTFPFSSY